MPKLKRWIVASKQLPVFPEELIKTLTEYGVGLAGSDTLVSQTMHVNAKNREQVIALLEKNGYSVKDIEG